MSGQRIIVAESLAPTPSTVLAAPAAPVAPAAYVTLAAHVAPADLRVFGNRMATVKEQDDTVYMILGLMRMVCSHCGALHWTEVTSYDISYSYSTSFFRFIVTLLNYFLLNTQERVGRAVANPRFSICCLRAKTPAIEASLAELQSLFRGDTLLSRRFLAIIRTFNNVFTFTSLGTNTN